MDERHLEVLFALPGHVFAPVRLHLRPGNSGHNQRQQMVRPGRNSCTVAYNSRVFQRSGDDTHRTIDARRDSRSHKNALYYPCHPAKSRRLRYNDEITRYPYLSKIHRPSQHTDLHTARTSHTANGSNPPIWRISHTHNSRLPRFIQPAALSALIMGKLLDNIYIHVVCIYERFNRCAKQKKRLRLRGRVC